jgi:hypothetical protein
MDDSTNPIISKMVTTPSTRPFSQRSQEGYLMVDHRASPGINSSKFQCMGLPLKEGSVVEVATLTCSHCKTVCIRNPLRVRDRGYCIKCNHYICDGCAIALKVTGVCRPWNQVVDEVMDGKPPVLARQV